MIKVLELIDGGFLGGGQTHILSLVKCLDKNIFDATLAASGKGEFKNAVGKNGYKFIEIELPKFYKSKYLNDLDRIVRENAIEIIHSHGGVAGMYARFYKKKFGSVKVIHTIHGIHYINSANYFKKIVSLSVEQYLVSFTDKFICVSKSDYETALKNKIINPGKTSVIKNGIDLKKYFRKPIDKNLLAGLTLNGREFIIGNISRFDFQKNQRFILSSAEFILEKYPEVKILFAGDGKLLNECMQMAEKQIHKNRIIFTGEVSNPEDYYSLFDIYVFPSLWEGLSISLLEAMASSNCILASNIPSNRELLKNNLNGYIFNVNSKNDFLIKLEKLIEDEKLRRSLSEQAFKDSGNYSDDMMTKKTETEYLNLIKN